MYASCSLFDPINRPQFLSACYCYWNGISSSPQIYPSCLAISSHFICSTCFPRKLAIRLHHRNTQRLTTLILEESHIHAIPHPIRLPKHKPTALIRALLPNRSQSSHCTTLRLKDNTATETRIPVTGGQLLSFLPLSSLRSVPCGYSSAFLGFAFAISHQRRALQRTTNSFLGICTICGSERLPTQRPSIKIQINSPQRPRILSYSRTVVEFGCFRRRRRQCHRGAVLLIQDSPGF